MYVEIQDMVPIKPKIQVESIDFKSIEEKYDGPGSPAYHPKVMMKLLIQSGMHST